MLLLLLRFLLPLLELLLFDDDEEVVEWCVPREESADDDVREARAEDVIILVGVRGVKRLDILPGKVGAKEVRLLRLSSGWELILEARLDAKQDVGRLVHDVVVEVDEMLEVEQEEVCDNKSPVEDD